MTDKRLKMLGKCSKRVLIALKSIMLCVSHSCFQCFMEVPTISEVFAWMKTYLETMDKYKKKCLAHPE